MTSIKQRYESTRVQRREAMGIVLTMEEDEAYLYDPSIGPEDPDAEYEVGERRYYVNGVQVEEWSMVQVLGNGKWMCESLTIKEQKL